MIDNDIERDNLLNWMRASVNYDKDSYTRLLEKDMDKTINDIYGKENHNED